MPAERVGTPIVVVFSTIKQMSKMLFAEDNNVVKALPPD
jgi:hypothetical protein